MMDVVYARCAGLDVHKKSVVACRITRDEQGEWHLEVRSFGTMVDDLLALADWLRIAGVTHVAMESTGVYWKPVFNILEGSFEVLLVNAKHIKFVPGRKTDVKDAQWIAELLQHGLLKASFIPPQPQRDLRELVRYRTHLIDERAREINRVPRFPNAAHLSSWAGLAPGKNESAGRNRSAKTNKANRYLKSALVEAAQAVGHHGQSYLTAQFARLATRRGKKRAAIAVAHSILVIAYHMLRDGTVFQDLGPAYFDQRKA